MNYYPIVVQVCGKVERYFITANSPADALSIFKKQMRISVPDSDLDGNYEIIYWLYSRKKYALVNAENPHHAMKKLKDKIGEDVYKKIKIDQINELVENIKD